MDTISIHETNPFNHFGFTIGPEETFVTRRPLESGPRIFEQTVKTLYVASKLSGLSDVFDRAYFWEANITVSKNSAKQINKGAHNASNLKRALGPLAECSLPCVPFDFLGGAGSITDEMLDWVGFVQRDKSDQSLFNVSFNVSGDLFTLSAGDVVGAAGFKFRSLEGSFIPDPIVSAGDTADLPAKPTDGDYAVSELYFEANVPLVDRIRGEFAIRGFNYSTFGTDTTTKTSLVWDTTDTFRIRASFAEGFRAPNIRELFGGQTRFDAGSLSD